MKKLLLILIAVALFAGCKDDSGTGDQTRNPVPTVSNPAVQNGAQPAAALEPHFSVKPKEGGTTSTTFKFDGSASVGSITKYNWDFGDGKNASGKLVNHKYAKTGTYKARLTVSTSGGQKASLNKSVKVGTGGGGGGGQACTNPASNRGFIYGTVTGVQGFNAIVKLDANSTCANSYYYCGDMRRKEPEAFRGIIHGMSDLGNHTFSVFNDCPAHWPPDIGERVFLYWKSCSQNYCP